MAKLYFSYAAMNAGKSTLLLQVAHNYLEREMAVYILNSALDNRFGARKVASRIGIEKEADTFDQESNLRQMIDTQEPKPACVLIDEAHWLTAEQVEQLARAVDELRIPILTYGLRTDFKGELFSGSERLLALADELREIRTVCGCGRKAIMTLRTDGEGNVLADGPQTQIGGNEAYVSVCRNHWQQGIDSGTVSYS